MLEKDIQKGILDYLSYRHVFHWRNNSGALKDTNGRLVRFGAVGSPDIFAIKNGVCYGIEVKTPKGIQSPAQKDFESNFVRAGGIYLLVRSLDDVINNKSL